MAVALKKSAELINMIIVHVLRVQKFNFVNYCYIVANSTNKTAILIDPAWEPEVIAQTLSAQALQPIAILLTHHHPDHVNLAPTLAKEYDLPVYMGKDEINYYQFTCHNLLSIENETALQLGHITVQPIATPGHTFGGLCYNIANHIFTGDTLFNEGCGVCLTKGSDPHRLFDSLQKLKKILSPNAIIYPGHCYGLPVGQLFKTVLLQNLYLQFTQAEDFVSFRMRQVRKEWFAFQ